MSREFEFSLVSEIVNDSTVFTWKIHNFLAFPIDFKDSIESSTFKCLNAECYLKLYPSGKTETSEFVGLIVGRADSSPSSYICHKIGLMDVRGEVCYTDCRRIREDPEDPDTKGQWTVISKATLMEKEAELLPGGVLTVCCELEVIEMKHNMVNEEIIDGEVEKEKSFLGASALSESIGSIFDDSEFSDVTLKVGEHTFRAHKAILASRSKVFRGMFQSGMKESREGVVEISDMNPPTAKEMLLYIYAGKVEKLSLDRALDLYSAADRYDLQELRGWCKQVIAGETSGDEVCDLAVLADLHGDEELARVAKNVFKRECKTILVSQAWRDLSESHPTVCMDLVDSTILNKS